MKLSKYTDSQIIHALKRVEGGCLFRSYVEKLVLAQRLFTNCMPNMGGLAMLVQGQKVENSNLDSVSVMWKLTCKMVMQG